MPKRNVLIAILGFPFLLAAVLILMLLSKPPRGFTPPSILLQGEPPLLETARQDTAHTPPPAPESEPTGPLESTTEIIDLENTEPEELEEAAASSSEQLYHKLFLLIREHKEEDAMKVLRKIVQQTPNDLRAHTLLAELYYKKDELPQAISHWEKIVHEYPTHQQARTLLEKARQEMKAHESFRHEMTRHFTIKFEGSENRHLYRTVLESLEEAYRDVGRALSFYPPEEVIVFLYTNQQFFDVTRAPTWSGGLFDGKIRIPARGYENQTDRLRDILFHEYVHAVVHRMTDSGTDQSGNTARVPIWLHEGVAQYFEPSDKRSRVNARLVAWAHGNGLIPLSQLHGSFMGLNGPQATIAYDESLSAVSFLVDQFGVWRLKRLLEELAQNGDMDEAMRNTLLISYEQFQLRWKSRIESS
jgi:tetratricopeptide (TPR) repeat protein